MNVLITIINILEFGRNLDIMALLVSKFRPFVKIFINKRLL